MQVKQIQQYQAKKLRGRFEKIKIKNPSEDKLEADLVLNMLIVSFKEGNVLKSFKVFLGDFSNRESVSVACSETIEDLDMDSGRNILMYTKDITVPPAAT